MKWRLRLNLAFFAMLMSCSGSDTVILHDVDQGIDVADEGQSNDDPGPGTTDVARTPKDLITTDKGSSSDIISPKDLTPTDALSDAITLEDTNPTKDQGSLLQDTATIDDMAITPDTAPPIDTYVPPTDPGPPPDPCDGVYCGANGSCWNGLCECSPGYQANPANSPCTDIDECNQGGSNCDANASCTNTEGSFYCTCLPGFSDILGNGTQCSVAYNACGEGRFSPKTGGTLDNPMEVPYLPMVDHNDTSAAADNGIATYDCAPSTLETGPEVVYRFTVDHPGDFHAKLNDPVGVDIDIHLVQNPVMNGSQMTGCIARDHEELTVTNLPAGEYWVFADSWSNGSAEYSGSYNLAFEWISNDVWNEVPVDTGIVWSRMRSTNGGDTQTINRITVELNQGWDLQPYKHSGCDTIVTGANELDALVGVNGGFFDGGCNSLDLLRADNVTYSTNIMTSYEQRTMGWNPGATPSFEWLDPNEDWTTVSDAIGGYPSLVTNGVGFAEAVPDSQVWSATDWARNPRTVTGVDSQNRLVMLTIDGRTAAGEGMTNPELALYLESLGIQHAIGLDGGGSTSMMVHDCWLNHVVNYPSDNNTADHYGLRSVADGFYIR